MKCEYCGAELTYSNYVTKRMCLDCRRAFSREYFREYRKRNLTELQTYMRQWRARGPKKKWRREEINLTNIKNGCKLYPDCLTCPFDDCKAEDR